MPKFLTMRWVNKVTACAEGERCVYACKHMLGNGVLWRGIRVEMGDRRKWVDYWGGLGLIFGVKVPLYRKLRNILQYSHAKWVVFF